MKKEVLLLLAILTISVITFWGFSASAEVKTISHIVISFDEISRTELRSLFSGKMKTFKGISFTIYAQPKYSSATIEFARDILHFSVEKFYHAITNWSSAGYTKKPRIVSDDYSMLLSISTTPYSIGYASSGLIYQNVGHKIRVLKIRE